VSAGDQRSGACPSRVVPERTSSTLLERAQAGDSESRALLWRIYSPLVRKKYLASVPDQDRDDLCQEVFLTLLQHIDGFHKSRADGPCFRPWLREIAFNKVGNYLKRTRRLGLTVSNATLDALAPHVAQAQDQRGASSLDEKAEVARAAFEEAVSRAEPRTREAARRVLLGNEPVDHVAADLGMTPNALYVAKSRVLARIRAILNEIGEPVATTTEFSDVPAEIHHEPRPS